MCVLQMPRDGCDFNSIIFSLLSWNWGVCMHWQIMECERQELKQDSDLVRRIVQDWWFGNFPKRSRVRLRRVLWKEVLTWGCVRIGHVLMSDFVHQTKTEKWNIRSWWLELECHSTNSNSMLRILVLNLSVRTWCFIPINSKKLRPCYVVFRSWWRMFYVDI